MQLMAAHGYVVVYANPRGSDSYGEAFGNHIHHAYPGDDYDDLMAVTDAVIARASRILTGCSSPAARAAAC
nr:prolyl oligopeptidase family serine peptidase [Hankyongella ginsenosidimutans]